MSDRPPLAGFDDETIERVATDHGLDPAALRTLVARHQEGVRDLPGVEDIVYEWRSQFHEDPLVHRTDAVYVLALRSSVWDEFADSLDLDGAADEALRAVHARQARSHVDGTDRLDAGAPMVLTRP